MVDWLPVASQLKSLVQVTFGDHEGARETQEKFIRQCPFVSQVTSAVQASKGDREAARRTQLEFLGLVGGIVDSVPLVGHLKGGIHYACRDKKRGDTALKASSHTSAAIAGGVGGFIVGGPAGATVGGIAAGTAMDGIITLSEYAVSRKYKPEGILRPLSDPKNPGKWVDGAVGVAVDGIIGKGAGTVAASKGVHVNPSAFQVTVSEEKKQALKSLVQLAAQVVAISTCTEFATRAGEHLGGRLVCELDGESECKKDPDKFPMILQG